MAVKFPNRDLPSRISSTSIAWDLEGSEPLLSQEFFAEASGACNASEIFRDTLDSGGDSAYSSTDVTVTGTTNSTVYAQISESLFLAGPASGKVQANCARMGANDSLLFYPTPVNSTTGNYHVDLIWRYRSYGAASWTDFGSAVTSTVAATVFFDSGGDPPDYAYTDGETKIPSAIVTGLSQGQLYEFALFGKLAAAGPKTMNFYGAGAVAAEILEPASGATGTASTTESSSDSIASAGASPAVGSLSKSETGQDASVSTGSSPAVGALAKAEAGADSAVSAGSSPTVGAASAAEAGDDVAVATGLAATSGQSSVSEAGADTAASSGASAATGSAPTTEGATDLAAATGSSVVSGVASASELGPDTLASTGVAGLGSATGAGAAAEVGADVAASSGASPTLGAATPVEAGKDASASTGASPAVGLSSVAEVGADIAASTGMAIVITGSGSAAEPSTKDVASSSGVAPAAGSLAKAESGADTAAAVGVLFMAATGAASISESSKDALASSGVAACVKDNTLASVSGTSFVAISDILALPAPQSGKVQLSAGLVTSVDSTTPYGEFEVQMVWRYRPVAGAFSDAEAPVLSAPNALYGRDPEFDTDILEYGAIASAPMVTGLTSGVTYEFQLFARRTSSVKVKTVFFSGVAIATAVGGFAEATGAAAIQEIGQDLAAGGTAKISTGGASSAESDQDLLASIGAAVIAGAMAAPESGQDDADGLAGRMSYGSAASSESASDAPDAFGFSPALGAMSAADGTGETVASAGSVGQVVRTGIAAAIELGRDMLAAEGSLGIPVGLPAYFKPSAKDMVTLYVSAAGPELLQASSGYLVAAASSNIIAVTEDEPVTAE